MSRARLFVGWIVTAGVSVGPVSVSPARAQAVGYTAALYSARTSYPEERITGVYAFNSLDATHGPVRASITVPFTYHRITFKELTGDRARGTDSATGFGDPLIRVDFRIVDDRSRGLQIGLAGSVKPSLVDPSGGLGTGATDVGAGASVFQTVGRTSILADVLFWKYGDPDGVDFRDTLSYSVGVGRLIGRGRWSAMVSLAGFSHAIDGAAPPLQLNVAMLTLVGRRQSLAITGGVGLNDTAGDFSIGTAWRIVR